MRHFSSQTHPNIINGSNAGHPRFHFAVLCMIALCLLGIPRRGWTQGGSPLKTHSTGTPAQGTRTAKLMFSFDDAGTKHVFSAPSLELKYGLLDNVELSAKVPWVVVARAGDARSGVGNSAISVKWRGFNDPETHRAIAMEPSFEFNNPTNSVRRGIASDGWKLRLPLMGSMNAGALKIGAEVGYQVAQRGQDAWMSGIAFGYAPRPTIDLAVEVHDEASHRWAVRDPVIGIGSRFRLPSHVKMLVGLEHHIGGTHARGRGAIALVGVEVTD